jgi:hypothetical protein
MQKIIITGQITVTVTAENNLTSEFETNNHDLDDHAQNYTCIPPPVVKILVF